MKQLISDDNSEVCGIDLYLIGIFRNEHIRARTRTHTHTQCFKIIALEISAIK